MTALGLVSPLRRVTTLPSTSTLQRSCREASCDVALTRSGVATNRARMAARVVASRVTTGGSTSTRRRPAPNCGSGPGSPRSRASPISWALADAGSSGAPAARCAPMSSASAPAALGAAFDVPPTDLGPVAVSTRVPVGATMSGFMRPSSVGPRDE